MSYGIPLSSPSSDSFIIFWINSLSSSVKWTEDDDSEESSVLTREIWSFTISNFLDIDESIILNNSLFSESSPGPVKFAASLLGLCNSETRLPLVDISEATKSKVSNCLKDLSLIWSENYSCK